MSIAPRKLTSAHERSSTFAGAGAVSPFDLWRRKLLATPAAVEEARPEALFVELTNPAHTRTSPTSSGPSAWEVELELGTGVVLRLRRAASC